MKDASTQTVIILSDGTEVELEINTDNNDDNNDDNTTLRDVGVASVLGVGAATAATPAAVTALGFTSSGIAAGSTAASMMSVLGGGSTAAGSLVAGCQSVGAIGSLAGATVGLPLIGCIAGVGLAGGALGYGVYRGAKKLHKTMTTRDFSSQFPELKMKLHKRTHLQRQMTTKALL
ncbi:unnamed protein product [Lasius platythorax]|uniref:Uncharacterized protein n=1 Tax=Lasius platythorax TaxID=488582 RepID=A0AAV2N4H3_9HYME